MCRKLILRSRTGHFGQYATRVGRPSTSLCACTIARRPFRPVRFLHGNHSSLPPLYRRKSCQRCQFNVRVRVRHRVSKLFYASASNKRRRHYVSGRPSGRPSVCRVTGYLCTWWTDCNETCYECSSCEWTSLTWFSRSEVKGQGHDKTECYNDGGMHFDCVSSSLTCTLQYS